MEPAAETGRRLALLVATSAYNDPDLRQLRAPGHDADQLTEVLGDPRIGGFDVQELINPELAEAKEGIEDFCTDRHPSDLVLIYLSCHGLLDSYGRLYYAAANTRRQRLAATAIEAAWLNERLEDCRARRQILVLDCCHSGAFAKGAKGDTELPLWQLVGPHGRGRVVLTASRSTEYSFEGGQASGEGVPSVFTDAVVNGLRTGDADRDKDGLITVTELYQYVFDSVCAAEPRQTPGLNASGAEGSILVAHSIRGRRWQWWRGRRLGGVRRELTERARKEERAREKAARREAEQQARREAEDQASRAREEKARQAQDVRARQAQDVRARQAQDVRARQAQDENAGLQAATLEFLKSIEEIQDGENPKEL